MKYRESGMPDEGMWDSFFSPAEILNKLGVDKNVKGLIDIGSGYGTFLIPAAGMISGPALGIDIEPQMAQIAGGKIEKQRIGNARAMTGDISVPGTSEEIRRFVPVIDCVLLFNILHCETPEKLISAVHELLEAGGRAAVIHWIIGDTPRGPSMHIRPTPEKISALFEEAGFCKITHTNLPPYHYGLVFKKEENK
jgi:SAM-dependent methyltransferase